MLQSQFISHRLSVLTWNIWFGPLQQKERFKHILSIVQESEPDVICLQEVIPSFLQYLRKDFPEILNRYTVSDYSGECESVIPYGTFTMCKNIHNSRFTIHDLPSNMNRKIVVLDILQCTDNCSPVVMKVGNVHLESLDNHSIRKIQLEKCSQLLKGPSDLVVLCGDFNFCSYRNFEPTKVPLDNNCLHRTIPQYEDLWSTLKPSSEPGYTYDTAVNTMIAATNFREERMRYDRIMLNIVNKENWIASSIHLVGTEPLFSEDGNNTNGTTDHVFGSPPPQRSMRVIVGNSLTPSEIFPSDHFGLLATIHRRT